MLLYFGALLPILWWQAMANFECRFLAQADSMRRLWNLPVRPVSRDSRGFISNAYYPGHSGEVFTVRFDPTAQRMASGSMDRSICTSDPNLSCFEAPRLTCNSFVFSALEHIWTMRELWPIVRPPRCGIGPPMGARFTSTFLCIGRHDTWELGRGNWATCSSPCRT